MSTSFDEWIKNLYMRYDYSREDLARAAWEVATEEAQAELSRLTAERDALTQRLEDAKAEAEALRKDSERIRARWADAYAAFRGAFDTPAECRKRDDDYATDARQRLYNFDAALAAQQRSENRNEGGV